MPPGITDIRELPYTYFDALCLALGFLTFEELPDDERPDKDIWLDPDEMKKHWALVKRMREARMKGDDADIRDQEIEGDVEHNAAADEMLGGLR